eukprot:g77238.t1
MTSLVFLVAWLTTTSIAAAEAMKKTECDKQCVADGMQGGACYAGCHCQDETVGCADWCTTDNSATYIYNYNYKYYNTKSVGYAIGQAAAEGVAHCLTGCSKRGSCTSANCSMASEVFCNSLNRHPCLLSDHTCGDCFEAFGSRTGSTNSFCAPGLSVTLQTRSLTMELMKGGIEQKDYRFHDCGVAGREALQSREDTATFSLSAPYDASVSFAPLVSGPAILLESFPALFSLKAGEAWDLTITFECAANGVVEVVVVVDVVPTGDSLISSMHVLRLQKKCHATCLSEKGEKLCFHGECMGRFCDCEPGFQGDSCEVFLGTDKLEYCPGEAIKLSWVLSAASTTDWVGIVAPFCKEDGVLKTYERVGCEGQTIEPKLTPGAVSAANKDDYEYAFTWNWFYLSGNKNYPTAPVPNGTKTISVLEHFPGHYAMSYYLADSYVASIVTPFTILDKSDPKCAPVGATVACVMENTESETQGTCLCKPRFFGVDCSLGCPELTEATAFGSVVASSPASHGQGYLSNMKCAWHIKPDQASSNSKLHLSSSMFGIDPYDRIQVFRGSTPDPLNEILPALSGLSPISVTYDTNELLLVFQSDRTIAGDPLYGYTGFLLNYQLVDACGPGSFINRTQASDGKVTFTESSCVPCPLGTVSEAQDSVACEKCPKPHGKICVMHACEKCPKGKFSNSTQGASVCNLVPAGAYTVEGASTFTLCSPGQFQARIGQDSCLPCIPMSYSSQSGASMCLPCERGTESLEGAAVCVESVSASRKALAFIMVIVTVVFHALALGLLAFRHKRPTKISSMWPIKLLAFYALSSLVVLLVIPLSSLLVATFPCTLTYWFGAMRVHILLAPLACLVYYLSSLLSISRIRYLLQQEVERMASIVGTDSTNGRRNVNMLVADLQRATMKPWKVAAIYGVQCVRHYPEGETKCPENIALQGLECFFVVVYLVGLLGNLIVLTRKESLGIKHALVNTLMALGLASLIYFPISFAVGFIDSFDQRFIIWAWAESAIVFLIIRPFALTFDFFTPAIETVNKKKLDVVDVLHNDRGYQFFLAHCRQEFSEENVLCWKQIDLYVRNTSLEALESIYHNFLDKNAPFVINISGALRQTITKKYHYRKKATMQELQILLKPVQNELEILMRADTWIRFLQSDLYQSYENGVRSPSEYKNVSEDESSSKSGSFIPSLGVTSPLKSPYGDPSKPRSRFEDPGDMVYTGDDDATPVSGRENKYPSTFQKALNIPEPADHYQVDGPDYGAGGERASMIVAQLDGSSADLSVAMDASTEDLPPPADHADDDHVELGVLEVAPLTKTSSTEVMTPTQCPSPAFPDGPTFNIQFSLYVVEI